MARTLQIARLNHPAPVSDSTANPPTTSPRLHTDFMEVKVHTAKCDSCDKHNKLTLYRCTECGQHVCSLCWNKKLADGTHDFGAKFRDVPELDADRVVKDDDADGEKEHENEGRTHSRRRVHVISDDEDDDLAVLKPAPAPENADANDASKQHKKKKNVVMHDDLRGDQEDDLPRLWPILPAKKLPVLRPAVPAANTSVTVSANRVTQRNPHIQEDDIDPEHKSIVRVYDDLGRQIIPSPYVFVGDQETNPQTCRPSQSSMSHQQANRSAPLHAQPAIYRPRPGADLDHQAARNQYAFANSQPTNRQAPRPAQPLIAQQQATQLAPRQIQPAVYRPRPGADLDRQAARNQLAFANRKRINHQAPQPGQASVSHQQEVRPAPRPAQASISPQHAQTAANMDQVAARNQQAHRLIQQAEAYANATQMDARNRQHLTSHQDTWLAANSDQGAAHYRQAFISNQLSSSGANYTEARDRHQANRPTPPAQTPVSHPDATESTSFSAQASFSQEHAALLNSRQAQHPIATQGRPSGPSGGIQGRERSPEVLEAAGVLLFYAGVEKYPGVLFRSDQDAKGVSKLLSAAGQLDKASPGRSESPWSSKTLVDKSGAAGTQSVSPRGPALNPNPRNRDADSAKARLDKHRARLAGLQSPSGTRNTVSDLPASLRGHPSYRHATSQPDSGPALPDTSAALFHGSKLRGARSYPSPRSPMSDHAATYLNQWNSGRAALPSSSNGSAVDVPARQLDHPRSPVPALHSRSTTSVHDTVASGTEEVEAAEASSQALSAPKSVTEAPRDVDVVMGGPEVEILEDDESRRSEAWALQNNPWTAGTDKGTQKARARAPEPIIWLHAEGTAEKHQRGEKQGERKTSKEQKASGDVDVVDARKRIGKGEHSDQMDDDGSDVEITSWSKLDSNKTTGQHGASNARAKGIESGRKIKKGVAYVKNSEGKGQKHVE